MANASSAAGCLASVKSVVVDMASNEVLEKLPGWWREIKKSIEGGKKDGETKNNGTVGCGSAER